jgi:hypothetical protein
VTHHEAHVHHRRHRGYPIEELGRGTPVPRHPLLQRFERHAFDARQHAHEVVGRLTEQRRDGESAVAGHHGGHAVQRRRRARGIPEHLRIVMRVDVDEAWRHHEPGRVDDPCTGRAQRARWRDLGDVSVAHPDVGHPRRRASAVDERSPHHHHIEHG